MKQLMVLMMLAWAVALGVPVDTRAAARVLVPSIWKVRMIILVLQREAVPVRMMGVEILVARSFLATTPVVDREKNHRPDFGRILRQVGFEFSARRPEWVVGLEVIGPAIGAQHHHLPSRAGQRGFCAPGLPKQGRSGRHGTAQWGRGPLGTPRIRERGSRMNLRSLLEKERATLLAHPSRKGLGWARRVMALSSALARMDRGAQAPRGELPRWGRFEGVRVA